MPSGRRVSLGAGDVRKKLGEHALRVDVCDAGRRQPHAFAEVGLASHARTEQLPTGTQLVAARLHLLDDPRRLRTRATARPLRWRAQEEHGARTRRR
jgi:hypothetical protein